MEVSRLLEDGAGRIWVGTRQPGAYVIGADRGAARSIAATTEADDAKAEIMAITGIAPNRIWLGTFGRGILEVDGATLRTHRIHRDPFVPQTLDGDTVRTMCRDRSGIVWVGTNEGLDRYSPGSGSILTVFGAAGRADGPVGEDVSTVLPRSDGTLWAGSGNDGIAILGSSGCQEGAVAIQRVSCMAETPTGTVLFGTRNGLYLADTAGRRVTRLDVPQRRATAGVFALRVLDGAVWPGGGDDALWKLRVDADGKVTVMQHEAFLRLTSGTIGSTEPGPDGLLAIGTICRGRSSASCLIRRTRGRSARVT